jgi:hypothetical protein
MDTKSSANKSAVKSASYGRPNRPQGRVMGNAAALKVFYQNSCGRLPFTISDSTKKAKRL